jgi:hypothetical protein
LQRCVVSGQVSRRSNVFEERYVVDEFFADEVSIKISDIRFEPEPVGTNLRKINVAQISKVI